MRWKPAGGIAIIIFPLHSFVEVVTILMSTLRETRHDQPVDSRVGVAPHSTAPLPGLDLLEWQVRAGRDRPDRIVGARLVRKRLSSLQDDGVGQFT